MNAPSPSLETLLSDTLQLSSRFSASRSRRQESRSQRCWLLRPKERAGRARHSVRAVLKPERRPRRARSDGPYYVSESVCQATRALARYARLIALLALCWMVTGCQTFNYTDEDLARERRLLAEGYASGVLCRGLGWWGNGGFGPYGGWQQVGRWDGGSYPLNLEEIPWAARGGFVYPRW